MNLRFTLYFACCIGLIAFWIYFTISRLVYLCEDGHIEMREVESDRTLPRACKAYGVSRCEGSGGMKLRLFHSWPSSSVYTSRSVRIVRRKGGQKKESWSGTIDHDRVHLILFEAGNGFLA